MLVVSLFELTKKNIEEIKKKIAFEYLQEKILVEIRLDLIDIKTLIKLQEKIDCPLILTIKNNQLKDSYLDKILKKLPFIAGLDIRYIDLEYDLDEALSKKIFNIFKKAKRICSCHFFEKKDLDLEEIFSNQKKYFKDEKKPIYKIAINPTSSICCLKMLLVSKKIAKKGYKICFIAMGEKGAFTRILSSLFSNFFTYCYWDKKTAKGQISLNKMIKRYRFLSIDKNTTFYVLIGSPISKSPSNIIHNKIFSHMNLNSLYLKIALEKEEMKSFFKLINNFPIKGLSITSPLKQSVLNYLDKIKDEKIKAINTAVKIKDKWVGYNTDKEAIKAILKRGEIKGKTALILGAGGVAMAIAYQLIQKGALVVILNRTKEKAQKLAEEYSCSFGSFRDISDFYQKGYDILINATSSLDPIDEKHIRKNSIVLDVNTFPFMTPFLEKASKKNCRIVHGFEMFVYQAKAQFNHFFKFHQKDKQLHL